MPFATLLKAKVQLESSGNYNLLQMKIADTMAPDGFNASADPSSQTSSSGCDETRSLNVRVNKSNKKILQTLTFLYHTSGKS